MGRLPSGQRKYHLKHLSETHLEVLRRIVRGHTPKRIEGDLGVSRKTISNARCSDIAQPILRDLQQERNREAARIQLPGSTEPDDFGSEMGALSRPLEQILAGG